MSQKTLQHFLVLNKEKAGFNAEWAKFQLEVLSEDGIVITSQGDLTREDLCKMIDHYEKM